MINDWMFRGIYLFTQISGTKIIMEITIKIEIGCEYKKTKEEEKKKK